MKKKIRIFILIIIPLILIILNFSILSSILSPFFISIIFAYLLDPIVDILEKKGFKRTFSIVIVFFIFFFGIGIFAFYFIPILIKEISTLLQNIPQYSKGVQDIIHSIQNTLYKSNLPNGIKSIVTKNITLIESFISNSLDRAINTIINMFSNIFEIVIIPVITFYLLKDSDYFKKQLILLMPSKYRNNILALGIEIDTVIGKYIKGQIVTGFFVGALTTIVLLIINVRYALILGIFTGLVEIIPYFGPFIAAIPTVSIALIDSFRKAIFAVLGFIIIQQIENNFLTPKIIGDSVGIHPVYVILALIIAGKFFGIFGLIIAVPLFASIKLIIRYIIRDII